MHSSLISFLTDPSFYVALVALLLSVWIYFAHDKRIKRQETLINQFELERLMLEKELQKKANLEILIDDSQSARKDLIIVNTGKNLASDIRISIEENEGIEGFIITERILPFELQPNQRRTITLFLHTGSPDCVTATLKWNDEYKADNEVTYKFAL
ncbi:MAG: hypothetical protein E6Q24_07110 [Chitinophagaceae bacterium]|nr:MAG: hypothetical protein E6Q24_07110 [Chitinophagaceae bacterium]